MSTPRLSPRTARFSAPIRGPSTPGIRKIGQTGRHGSRLSRLKALGRDDNGKAVRIRDVQRAESSLARQLLQLGADLGRSLDHRVPGDLVGKLQEPLRLRRAEVERLDAGLGLARDLLLVDRLVLGIEPF